MCQKCTCCSPYILIGSAGMELKTKNICKKALNSLKTASLFVSTGFLMRESSNLVVQRFLTLSNIYLNFLLFFRSRVPLIFQSGTLLAIIQTPTREDHVTYIRDARWSHDPISSSAAQNQQAPTNLTNQ